MRDLAKPAESIPINSISGNEVSSRLARISGGWMYYGQDGAGTVSLIGLDKDGTQYVGDVLVDLTRVPAYFSVSICGQVNGKQHIISYKDEIPKFRLIF